MNYSLFSLLTKHSVKIPLIQRDYAQGRSSEEELRNSFISKLAEVINQVSSKLNLDFIYGYTEPASKLEDVFVPLDGQQRLTTLWLIHWYFASKENIPLTGNYEALSKFSYKTRVSARRFCQALVENRLFLTRGTDIRKEITNAPWYISSWRNDPTIISMLNMLETIHRTMFSCEDVWKKLTEKNTITFDYIDIKSENFKLTDELYIKMNSRGKPLTPFENFKAMFSQLLDNINTDFKDSKLSFEGRQVSYQEYFAFNIDGKWVDIFWNYSKILKKDVDKSIMNFVYYIAEMQFYKNSANDTFEPNFESLKEIFRHKENVDFLLSSLDVLADIDDIENFFNLIFTTKNFEQGRISLFDDKTNNNLFQRLFSDIDFDAKHKIILYAILKYCIENQIILPDIKLVDFTRILRNMILRVRQINTSKRIDYTSNLRIYNFNDYYSFIEDFVNEIKLNPEDNVYKLFSKFNFKSFSKEIRDSEKEKARHIIKNRDVLLKLEEHNHIQGITDNFYYESENLPEIVDAVYQIWNAGISSSHIIRAMLVSGDYSVQTHSYSSLGSIWYFGSEKNWNRILTTYDKNEQDKVRVILNSFLENYIKIPNGSPTEKLLAIIASYDIREVEWRKYFIKYKEMTSSFYDRLNLFVWDDGGFNIQSLGNSGVQPLSSYHLNPYLITLYKLLDDDKKYELYYGRFSDPLSSVRMKGKVNFFCSKDSWHVYEVKKDIMSQEIIKDLNIEVDGKTFVLRDNEKMDRIEVALELCRRLCD